jgi:hypothetical protein
MHFERQVADLKRALCWLPATLLAIGLTACGGSGSSAAPPPSGSTQTPRLSVGPITGFGSVHVNGVKFDTSSASITVDGVPATQDDLKVGYVVRVSGYHDERSGRDHADRVDCRKNVQGPVSSVVVDTDANTQTLVVLGQTVVVTADTSLSDDITVDAPIAVDDILEVSGMVAADGSIQATRIEREPAGSPYKVFGPASSTSPGTSTLMINALTVDYSAAMLKGFPATGPADGDLVAARGTGLGTEGQLLATSLELVADYGRGHDHEEAELEGLVSDFTSPMEVFKVAGEPVMLTDATVFYGGTSADLANDVRIEAEGAFDAAGVLVAAKVRIFSQFASSTRLVGQVDAVSIPDPADPNSGTVTMLGVTVSVTDMTRFEDHDSHHLTAFSLADLHTGDWLEVRGSEDPPDSNMIAATRLERIRPRQSVGIAGIVKTAATPPVPANADFTILSVNIMTTDATRLTDRHYRGVTPDVFFTGLAGQRVGVRGTWDGSNLTAGQATLAGHDWEDHH